MGPVKRQPSDQQDPDVWGADEAALDISWLSLDSPGLTMVTFGFVSSMYTLSAVSARESRGLVVVSTWTVVPAKAGVVSSVEEAARLPEFPAEKGSDTRPELKESPEAPICSLHLHRSLLRPGWIQQRKFPY